MQKDLGQVNDDDNNVLNIETSETRKDNNI